LRSVRAIGVTDGDGRPMYTALRRLRRDQARFFVGTCSKGDGLHGAYAGAFWRDARGRRSGRMFFFFGSTDQLDQMRTKAEEVLAEYRSTMESHGQYPETETRNG
jgi:hypothetical protein